MIGGMEPDRRTDSTLAQILAELSRLEVLLHWPEPGTSRVALERMTVEDFWETGASGRRYARAFVMDVLEQRMAKPQPDVWETSDFRCQQLAAEVYLLTYTLLQDQVRLTRRATIWRKTSEGWKAVYHQGTVVE
jgi:hypothetical protein